MNFIIDFRSKRVVLMRVKWVGRVRLTQQPFLSIFLVLELIIVLNMIIKREIDHNSLNPMVVLSI